VRFLGIDYGTKRVGLAISDEMGKLAFPLKILKNDRFLIDLVHSVCGEEEITEIVLGESLDFSGKQNELMKEIDNFKKEIAKLGLPIHFEKEFLTTIAARGRGGKEINNAKKLKTKENKKVDASAAALILQRYLDRRSHKNEGLGDL